MEDLDRVTSSVEHERRQLADLAAIAVAIGIEALAAAAAIGAFLAPPVLGDSSGSPSLLLLYLAAMAAAAQGVGEPLEINQPHEG